MSYDKDRDKIEEVVDELINMEDAYDDSMFSFFVNDLVEKYSTKRALDIVKFFDNIMENQKEKVGSYGDADVTITKLNVKNIPKEKTFSENTTFTYTALQLIVECSGYAFFVISKLENRTFSSTRTISVYYCPQERVDSINLNDIIDDHMSKNFCFELKINFYGEEVEYPEGLRFYDFPHNTFYHFKQVYKELRSICKYGFEEDDDNEV